MIAADTPATIALALLTVASASGLVRVFSGHSWLGPVVVVGLGVHAATWALRRWRLPTVAATVLGLGCVWLLSVWVVLGPYTRYGFPGGHAVHQFTLALRQARTDFSTAIAPVEPTQGFRLVAALGTGAVAFLGDWIAFRARSVFLGAAPAFAMFIVCCTTGGGPGRQWAVAVEVLTLGIFMLAYRVSGGGPSRVWFAGSSAGVGRWAATAGALTGGLALLSGLLITPLMAPQDGVGVFGWRSGSGPGSSGPRIVPNPVVDLQTRLIQLAAVPVFKVTTSVPSYWRLTSLDTFNGATWTATGAYRGFGARLPGNAAIPPATRTVQATFQVQNLDSVWLPDAFTPVSVDGVKGVSYDPTSGSLITSSKSSNGLDYSVTSYQYLSTLSPAALRAAPPVTDQSILKRYLELPTGPNAVAPQVVQLAERLTSGYTTEYDKAVAILNYFHTGHFKYSLSPTSDGTSNNALLNFLFVTQSGYCQQYAGAFAALARIAGLPTRLAVGFATGILGADGRYQVYDSDAHTWPEVYFGPQYGWLPFEPTPSFNDPNASSYAPVRGSNGPAPVPGNPEAPAPKGNKTGAPNQAQRPTPTTISPATAGKKHASTSAWTYLLIVLPIVPGWIMLNAAGRRLRWRIRRRRSARFGTERQVLARWADVSELLAWWGVHRRASETDEEFAQRAADRIGHRLGEPSPWLVGGVLRMAGLAREASFAPRAPSTRPDEAALVATEIHKRLFRSANARQLIAWAFLPIPGRAGPSPA